MNKMLEFADYVTKHSKEECMIAYSLTEESLFRKVRKCKQQGLLPKSFYINSSLKVEISQKKKNLAERIVEKFSEAELKVLLENVDDTVYKGIKRQEITINSTKVKFGIISDTHIGSKYFNEDNLLEAFKVFKAEGVDFICHVGDVVEGLSKRDGHVLEVTHFGYKDQRDYAISLLKRAPAKIFGISGNHDRWFLKQNGADIVEDIFSNLKDGVFLGHDEGDIIINGVTIRLWHGEDGASYAASYRLQKIIEALPVEDRPDMIIAGHDHKSLFLPEEQGVIAIGSGSIQSQTKWMRGKRLPAKCGFWLIELEILNNKIKNISLKWHKQN